MTQEVQELAVAPAKVKLRVVRCAVCSKPKYRESDPAHAPGHYFRARLSGWCACEDD